MKKAFCEPGNISFCPPISFASALCFEFSGNNESLFTVPRSTENGGDLTFTTRAELEAAFVQGELVLHPGDLKGAVIPLLVSTLDKLANGMKSDSDCVKASKTLKALAKKMTKVKNKK